VIGILLNGKLTVFSTESTQITNVKLKNAQDQVSKLTPVVEIGQVVDTAVNQVIAKETTTDVKVALEDSKQQPKNITERERICLFTPDHPICKPDENGDCHKNWGRNENGQCFPIYKECPQGYWRAEDDETGACVPLPETDPESEPEPYGGLEQLTPNGLLLSYQFYLI
jgi:hypothetical protein